MASCVKGSADIRQVHVAMVSDLKGHMAMVNDLEDIS